MGCRVLVPLDGSALAEVALAAVEVLARAGSLELVLLRVVPPLGPLVAEGRVVMTADDAVALHRREAIDYLAKIAAVPQQDGLRTRTRVAIGDPAEVIRAEAARQEASVIVMATHGRTGLPRLLFGSVAAAVVKASPVPVLTVHQAPARDICQPKGA